VRHGFTLPEILLVLAIIGLSFGIAVPRIAALRDGMVVEQETNQILAAHHRSRMLSIARGRPVVLSIGADSVSIRLVGDAADLWAARGPVATGVTLEGPVRRMTFSPLGYTTGLSNATLRLSRGAAHRTIVVSRLGRVRVTRP
jgi:prepilin-type N-terminal cleavage/methylation domain-containing protein